MNPATEAIERALTDIISAQRNIGAAIANGLDFRSGDDPRDALAKSLRQVTKIVTRVTRIATEKYERKAQARDARE